MEYDVTIIKSRIIAEFTNRNERPAKGVGLETGARVQISQSA